MGSKSRIAKYIIPITRSIGSRTLKDVEKIDVKERLFKWKGKTNE